MDAPNKSLSTRLASYGPFSALVVTVGSYFGSQVLAGIFISFLPLFTGWTDSRLTWWLDTVVGQFVTVLLVEASILGLIGFFIYAARVRLKTLGVVRLRPFRDISYALVAYIVYFAAFVTVTVLARELLPSLDVDQKQDIFFNKQTTGPALLLIFASLVVLPPITEEFVVRGFLYTGLRKKLPFFWSALAASVLFGAAHLQWGSGKPLLWIAALDTFVLSLILIYLREKTHSLWPCILVHMFKNTFAFYLLFILKVA